ncbi:hypothetical protein [Streptomyces sp. ML-6]|uniref:hypothetical protein n=1 Tax=Streptomyces sp. ML-6 TaxID=2982693 RepID=UPI0024C0B365|nr:hypothetical protein [Streptomyces sp. ML-6]MDK0520349.1 hypothetical protein [Streptomyces sp. ML-6]
MNTPQPTRRRFRAGLAIYGARSARQHIARTAVIARQLELIAPGTTDICITPVTVDDTPRTHVQLLDALALPLATDREAHGAAARLLRHMYPRADWSAPQRYSVRDGRLTPDAPNVPAALGIDTAEVAR